MRSLAERIVSMNYGVHRLLSHLIDVRREKLIDKIKYYESQGDFDVSDHIKRKSDLLADELESMLKRGLF